MLVVDDVAPVVGFAVAVESDGDGADESDGDGDAVVIYLKCVDSDVVVDDYCVAVWYSYDDVVVVGVVPGYSVGDGILVVEPLPILINY